MAFTSHSKLWLASETRRLRNAEKTMGDVILNRAKMIAPVLTGALRANGRVEQNPKGGISVVFGDVTVPYARRRHFENRKNPHTLQYLRKAGDSVVKEGVRKYYK